MRERQRDPNGLNGQNQAKSGAQSFFLVLHGGAGAQALEPSHTAFPSAVGTLDGSWIGSKKPRLEQAPRI